MCIDKRRAWVLFQFQVSVMSKIIPLKMEGKLLHELYVIACRYARRSLHHGCLSKIGLSFKMGTFLNSIPVGSQLGPVGPNWGPVRNAAWVVNLSTHTSG